MEIKSVEKKEIQYPKNAEIDNKKVKKAIPNKWLKLGFTSGVMMFIMKNKAFAEKLNASKEVLPTDIAGFIRAESGSQVFYNPIRDYLSTGLRITIPISVILFLVSLIMAIYAKLKTKKVSKKVKRLLIVATIVLIILSSASYVVNNLIEWKSWN